MDISLRKLPEMVKDREVWHAVVHGVIREADMTEPVNNSNNPCEREGRGGRSRKWVEAKLHCSVCPVKAFPHPQQALELGGLLGYPRQAQGAWPFFPRLIYHWI